MTVAFVVMGGCWVWGCGRCSWRMWGCGGLCEVDRRDALVVAIDRHGEDDFEWQARHRLTFRLVVEIRPGPSVAVFPPGCRLRSGRFDRLPPLESLFSCWPKRKVTQREWPLEPGLVALRWDKPERLRMVVAWQPPPPPSGYFIALRNAPRRRGLKAQNAPVAFLWERTLCATNLRSDTDEAPVAHRVRSHKGFASPQDRLLSAFAFAFGFGFCLGSLLPGSPYDSGGRVEE